MFVVFLVLYYVRGYFFCLRRGRCVLSYPSDELSDDIAALISTAPTLTTAAASIGTITSGSDVLVSNFAGVQAVFTKLSAFLSELQSGHFYCPVGALMPFAGTSAYVPSGWLLCNGQGYGASGAGIGPASANLQIILNAAGFSALPDLQGKVIAGVGTILGSARSVGTSVGAETFPAHTHSISGSGTTSGHSNDHTHGYYQQPGYTSAFSGGSGIPRAADNNAASGGFPTNTGGASADHTHTYSFSGTSGSAGTGSHGVVQPTIVMNYIIKN